MRPVKATKSRKLDKTCVPAWCCAGMGSGRRHLAPGGGSVDEFLKTLSVVFAIGNPLDDCRKLLDALVAVRNVPLPKPAVHAASLINTGSSRALVQVCQLIVAELVAVGVEMAERSKKLPTVVQRRGAVILEDNGPAECC